MDIGHRLKAVRTKAALSQRELAKRSGVTNGFISQIEKNQVSPSVASLRKVLEGIPMSLASFFTDETEMDSEVIFRADDMPDLGTHPISYRLVGHSRANRAIGMMQEILPRAPTPVTTCLVTKGKSAASSSGVRWKSPWASRFTCWHRGWLLLRQPHPHRFATWGIRSAC